MPKDQLQNDPAMEGGPVQNEPLETNAPNEPAPSGKRIKYAGKEYAVPDEVAAVWEDREQTFKRKLNEQGTELGHLRQRVTQQPAAPQPPASPATADEYDTLFFESPSKAAAKLRHEAKQEAIQEIMAMYQQQEAIRGFWGAFYEDNPDLKDSDVLVKAHMQNHWDVLAPMEPQEAAAKLAELTRGYLLKISGKAKEGERKPLPQGRAVVEGSSRPKTPAAPAHDEAPGSIGATLRARRDARRKAAQRLVKKD